MYSPPPVVKISTMCAPQGTIERDWSPRDQSSAADIEGDIEAASAFSIIAVFSMICMIADPQALTAVVTGTLKTFVGAQVIASQQRSFAFSWKRRGLSLGLTGFRQLPNENEEEDQ